MKRATIIIMGILVGGCFEDTGSPPDDTSSTGTSTATSSVTDGGDSSEPDDTETGTDSGDGGSSGDETSQTSGSESGSGSEACTVTSCPDGEFCVDGVCGLEPPEDMIVIPGGTFYRGCKEGDTDCEADEFPVDPDLFVSTFAIDRTAVTAGAYQACMDEGGCTPASTDLATCNGGRYGYEQHPINCVTWFQAEAYCAWAGKRLLTEAEWEKAARGTDARLYPWGEEDPSCDRMVMDIGGDGCGTGETWPVGSKPAGASPYGVLDAAGNTQTWIADWYAEELEVDIDDPTGPENGEQRTLRGSSFLTIAFTMVRVSNRRPAYPEEAAVRMGIRCAAG